MANPIEKQLIQLPMKERRGVCTTWGADTWESVLIQADFEEATDRLVECIGQGIGGVEPDVTEALLNGKLAAPNGLWYLLIDLDDDTGWLQLVHGPNGFGDFETLARQVGRPVMRTGYEDISGSTYARVREVDEYKLIFESTGMQPDPEDSDPDDVYVRLESARLPEHWIESYKSEDLVQQALMRELEAYVPMIGAYSDEKGNLQLWAGHPDAIEAQNVRRAALVLVGRKRSAKPGPASKKLKAAIEKGDVAAVQEAIDAGASLSEVVGSGQSPLTRAVTAYGLNDEDRLAMIEALLKAGADPDDGGSGGDPPLIAAIDKANMLPRLTYAICELVFAYGGSAEVLGNTALSQGLTPLLKATFRNQYRVVQYLHARGADPCAINENGKTAADVYEENCHAVGKRMGRDPSKYFEGWGETILAYLRAAEAGAPATDEWRPLLTGSPSWRDQ